MNFNLISQNKKTTPQCSRMAYLPSLKLLGDFWTLRLIDALKDGELRFCQLQRSAENVNPVTLTNKLKKLEQSKLIIRKELSSNQMAVSYQLTDTGRAALPIIRAIEDFTKIS
jgi:DNA-binding HxlR family transcriptional regulator